MSKSKRKLVIVFDVAVIGAGQAGPALAMTLAGRGEKVALIEGGWLAAPASITSVRAI